MVPQEQSQTAPQLGDMVSITYCGQPAGKGYYLYKVRLVGGAPRQVDWGKFGAPVEPDTPIDSSGLESPATASVAEQAAERFGDAVPFR